MKSFSGLRALWAYDWRQQGERTTEAIIARCREYGVTALMQELAYKMKPQVGGAPQTLSEIAAFRDQLAAAGIALVPVFVPGGLAGEAEMHGEIAKLCGCCVVDLEWDQTGDYWSVDGALIRVYARALRAAAGTDCLIGWQPDSRVADDGRALEWENVVTSVVPYVDAFWPQLYCGAVNGWAYGGGMQTVSADERRFKRFATLGKPVYPTLYTADSLWEPRALWERVRGQTNAFCAFRLGATNAEGLAMIAEMPIAVLEPQPVPEPVPQPDVTLEGVQLGLVRKVLDQDWKALASDAGKLAGVA